MKKLFILSLMTILIGIFNLTYAAEPVQVYDADMFTLQKSIQESNFSKAVQKDLPLVFTNVLRLQKLDIPERNLNAHMGTFGLTGRDKPDGSIIFYTNDSKSVAEIKIVKYDYNTDSKEVTAAIIAITLNSLGLNSNEVTAMLTNNSKVKNVWCASKNRRFLLASNETDTLIIANR